MLFVCLLPLMLVNEDYRIGLNITYGLNYFHAVGPKSVAWNA